MPGVKMLEKVINSDNFTVGGGASSALSGAMAAGMISMVAKLSLNKEYGLPKDRYIEISEIADNLAKELLLGAEADEKAFCKIKEAYSLPKVSEEEKRVRASAIQIGGIAAATVPKDNGYMCKALYNLGMTLKENSNPNCGSDLDVAIMLSELGIKGCILNVEANLPLIKEEGIKSQFINFVKDLKQL